MGFFIHAQGWWNWDGWPTAGEWSAWWAFLTFFVAAIAAFVALAQLSNYIREQEERARPFVIVDYSFRSVLMQVEIRNDSPSIATDVSLRVDVPFESNLGDRADVMNRVFSDAYSIKQLSPGRSIRWTLDRAPDYFSKELPRNYVVTATYTDPRAKGRGRGWKIWLPKLKGTYVETFDLNLEQWSDANADVDYDNKNWNIHSQNQSVFRKVERSLDKIAETLDELTMQEKRRMPITKRGRRPDPYRE